MSLQKNRLLSLLWVYWKRTWKWSYSRCRHDRVLEYRLPTRHLREKSRPLPSHFRYDSDPFSLPAHSDHHLSLQFCFPSHHSRYYYFLQQRHTPMNQFFHLPSPINIESLSSRVDIEESKSSPTCLLRRDGSG